jgi:hypothetical protein
LATRELVEFANGLVGSLPFGVCTAGFGTGSLALRFDALVCQVRAFSLLNELTLYLLQLAKRLEALLLLPRQLVALGLGAFSLLIRTLSFSLGAEPFPLGSLVLALGSLAFLLEAFPHRRKLGRKLGDACDGGRGATSFGFDLLIGSVGSLAFRVRALALAFRVLPRLKRSFTFRFGNSMFLFGATVFLFSAFTLRFGTLGLGFGVASGDLGALSFLFGSRSFFLDVGLFLFETLPKALDLSGALEPGVVVLFRLIVFVIRALVFAVCSVLLPIGALSLVFDALPSFSDPSCVAFTVGELPFCLLAVTFDPLANGVVASVKLLGTLPLGVGTLPLGIGTLSFGFYANL